MLSENNIVKLLIFLSVVLAFYGMVSNNEKFCGSCDSAAMKALKHDLDKTQYTDYGLRGEPIQESHIHNNYISDKRNIRLSNSGEVMWESSFAPHEHGMKKCKKVDCANVLSVDEKDTCWQCDVSQHTRNYENC